jgi:hypothetical protein
MAHFCGTVCPLSDNTLEDRKMGAILSQPAPFLTRKFDEDN